MQGPVIMAVLAEAGGQDIWNSVTEKAWSELWTTVCRVCACDVGYPVIEYRGYLDTLSTCCM